MSNKDTPCNPKACELINLIYEGTPTESYFCRTHSRPYWPNRKPTPENSHKELSELRLAIREVLNNSDSWEQTGNMLERFVQDYTKQAVAEALKAQPAVGFWSNPNLVTVDNVLYKRSRPIPYGALEGKHE